MKMMIFYYYCWNSTLVLFLLYVVYGSWRRLVWRRKLPPGSVGLPFIGETIEFISSSYSSRPEGFMDKRRLKYGKVFKSHLFGSPTIVTVDAEISRIVLQSDSSSFVPSYPKSLTELMGESSILLISGNLQKKIHGLIGSFFKSGYLKTQFTDDMETHVHALMDGWEDGDRILVQDEAKQIAFKVLVRGLIGMEPGEEMQYLMEQFQQFIGGLISLPIKIPGSRLHRSLQAKKRMTKIVKRIINDRRREKKKNRSCSNQQQQPRDVIDVLVNDDSPKLTDDLISDNMIDLIIPGEDSVPTLITLLVKYLSESPAALLQIEEENAEMKTSKVTKGEELVWTDYLSMPFTQNVISETLRLGNIISGIMRRATRDIEIKGHFIPKGWCVFPYFRSIHLDRTIYDDPHTFNPWRWQKKKKEEEERSSFTPFGGGRRLCPGLDLARLEATIFLHHLVTNFTWIAEDDTVVNFPTVRLKSGMPIRITRKKKRIYPSSHTCEC